MAKKPSAIYEPGELEKIRGRLGPVDETEAKLIAKKLGGEIGTEKSVVTPPVKKSSYVRREKAELAVPVHKSKRPRHSADAAANDDYGRTQAIAKHGNDPSDDPSVQLKTSYFERVKMDRYAAQPEFEIKSSLQALVSILCFFGEPADNVNPRFTGSRMGAYYKKIELLVNATRALLPRNSSKRSEHLKKASPFYLAILDVIRNWDIERIDEELTKIRAQKRQATVFDFAEIMRNIYKPLFILEKLAMEPHIKGAYKILYKVICIEDPSEPKERSQGLIRSALAAFSDIRLDVHFGLYPLLMKYISDRWFPYEQLFIERRRRFMSFISLTEHDQIKPLEATPGQIEDIDLENAQEEQQEEAEAEAVQEEGVVREDPQIAEKKAREEAVKAEKRAMDHSMKVLDSLFPKAGWDKLEEYPDLYPYFVNLYQMRRGYELLGPTDPLQQVAVLMHIMEDICVGLRNVTFGTAVGPDGNPAQINDLIGSTIINWRRYIDDSFVKEYLPRLTEYCSMIEHSAESRVSSFAKKTLDGLRWLKRLYFLPYFKFESLGPPPFQKQDIVAIYSEVRSLRKCLTLVAAGIEQGNRMGGAEVKAPCGGIVNPWSKYNFEIPNPVSKRIDALLVPEKRNNTAIIFFALSVVTVLDNLLNNENSWAYGENAGPIFRSVKNEGVTPVFGVDNKLDADKIFKEEMMKKQQEKK
ncbi:MAG: hypothetical protein LBU85_04495 [Treponema sp.]|jgi:hypothetical protein|nr:hypothetical protein [Treponema sp.]